MWNRETEYIIVGQGTHVWAHVLLISGTSVLSGCFIQLFAIHGLQPARLSSVHKIFQVECWSGLPFEW